MIFPAELRKGDVVALIAPSSPISSEEAPLCRAHFEALGYEVRMSSLVFASLHGYEAGFPEERAKEMNAAFANPDIKAIFCLRGGNSACRVLDKIDVATVQANPKIFVGYSDVTPFHILFNQKAELVTFHGPMVRSNRIRDFDDYSRASFEAVVNMKQGEVLEFRNPLDEGLKNLSRGAAEGLLVGGNLALIASLMGTPYELDARDKILLIEDVDESVPRVARMLHHLRLAGTFDDVAGVLVGDFTDCKNSYDANYGVEALLTDFFASFPKPVVGFARTGHCFPMATVPLGATCRIRSEGLDATVSFHRDF